MINFLTGSMLGEGLTGASQVVDRYNQGAQMGLELAGAQEQAAQIGFDNWLQNRQAPIREAATSLEAIQMVPTISPDVLDLGTFREGQEQSGQAIRQAQELYERLVGDEFGSIPQRQGIFSAANPRDRKKALEAYVESATPKANESQRQAIVSVLDNYFSAPPASRGQVPARQHRAVPSRQERPMRGPGPLERTPTPIPAPQGGMQLDPLQQLANPEDINAEPPIRSPQSVGGGPAHEPRAQFNLLDPSSVLGEMNRRLNEHQIRSAFEQELIKTQVGAQAAADRAFIAEGGRASRDEAGRAGQLQLQQIRDENALMRAQLAADTQRAGGRETVYTRLAEEANRGLNRVDEDLRGGTSRYARPSRRLLQSSLQSVEEQISLISGEDVPAHAREPVLRRALPMRQRILDQLEDRGFTPRETSEQQGFGPGNRARDNIRSRSAEEPESDQSPMFQGIRGQVRSRLMSGSIDMATARRAIERAYQANQVSRIERNQLREMIVNLGQEQNRTLRPLGTGGRGG